MDTFPTYLTVNVTDTRQRPHTRRVSVRPHKDKHIIGVYIHVLYDICSEIYTSQVLQRKVFGKGGVCEKYNDLDEYWRKFP